MAPLTARSGPRHHQAEAVFGGDKAMRLMSADPATIVTLLGELRAQPGDLERFVALHGVPADTIAALKTHALD